MSDKIIQKDLFGNEIKDVLSKNKTKGKQLKSKNTAILPEKLGKAIKLPVPDFF